MHREVQLVMGGYGVGKSTAAVSIANANPNWYVHYIWADRPIDKLFEIYPEVENRNLLEYPVASYEDTIRALGQIESAVVGDAKNHWIISDTIGQIYRSFQEGFTRSRYGQSLDQFKTERLTRLQSNPGDPALRGLIDGFQSWEWRWIRDHFYNDYFFRLLRRMSAHLFFIAHTVPQKGGFYTRPDAVVAKDRFRQIGLLPDCHHDVPGFVDTIMMLGIENDGRTHSMQTIKESGARDILIEPTPFVHYWRDYQALAMRTGRVSRQQ